MGNVNIYLKVPNNFCFKNPDYSADKLLEQDDILCITLDSSYLIRDRSRIWDYGMSISTIVSANGKFKQVASSSYEYFHKTIGQFLIPATKQEFYTQKRITENGK